MRPTVSQNSYCSHCLATQKHYWVFDKWLCQSVKCKWGREHATLSAGASIGREAELELDTESRAGDSKANTKLGNVAESPNVGSNTKSIVRALSRARHSRKRDAGSSH